MQGHLPRHGGSGYPSASDDGPRTTLTRCAGARTRVRARRSGGHPTGLPELGEAVRAFEPVPGPAGESAAEWLIERALGDRRRPRSGLASATARSRVSTRSALRRSRSAATSAPSSAAFTTARSRRSCSRSLRGRGHLGIGEEFSARRQQRPGRAAVHRRDGAGGRPLRRGRPPRYGGNAWAFRTPSERVPGNRRLRRLWLSIPASRFGAFGFKLCSQ